MNVLSNLLRQAVAGLRVLLVMTVLTGILYPLAVWGVSRLPGLRANAEGSIVTLDGKAVGSGLIGVDLVDERAAGNPTQDRFFHNRPSALYTDGPLGPADPSSSLASNKAGDNEDLKKLIEERKQLIAARERVEETRIPADAVTASASSLDPHISPAYAELQVPRVARENNLPEGRVRELVAENTTGRGLGALGDPALNVLTLNLAVQQAAGR